MAEPEDRSEPRRGETYSRTDDDRAREAVERPLEAAAKPAAPSARAGGVGWAKPAAAVAAAVLLLIILVAVFT